MKLTRLSTKSNLNIKEGQVLWAPSDQADPRIKHFMQWVELNRGLRFKNYQELWEWSTTDLEGFWGAIWDFFEIKSQRGYQTVLGNDRMPGATWFPGTSLNYAENALEGAEDQVALLCKSELRSMETITYAELRKSVASVALALRNLGVKRGDRVVAYMPNIRETVVCFLATSSIGAVWSICSPEFGIGTVIDRFKQINPKVLICVDGYRYGGRNFKRTGVIEDIQNGLNTLEQTIVVPYLDPNVSIDALPSTIYWSDLVEHPAELLFEAVPFDHPLWILYSSGTTGLPKPIVQGHGGILLEHIKVLALHMDLDTGDRFFWFTTSGWMMWNLLVGGLLIGATAVLYDGDPAYPTIENLWEFAQDSSVTYFGTSAPFIQACMKDGISPGKDFNLESLKGLGSTGSPLSPEGFQWVYDNVSQTLLLGSFSGGTDLCTGFVGPCPLLPVRAGEIQCLCLGASIRAYDEDGQPVIEDVGELVITKPMPSMPLYLWNDPGNTRYVESYFDTFPEIWRHGDWVKITSRQSCVIYGRSDSTLNRGGVRMGTSEFYRVLDGMGEILDSLVVDTSDNDDDGRLLLFLVLGAGVDLNDSLRLTILKTLRAQLSPRHTPDEMFVIDQVPRTLSGKKIEVPVRKILAGTPVNEAVSSDAMSNPGALDFFVDLSHRIHNI